VHTSAEGQVVCGTHVLEDTSCSQAIRVLGAGAPDSRLHLFRKGGERQGDGQRAQHAARGNGKVPPQQERGILAGDHAVDRVAEGQLRVKSRGNVWSAGCLSA
jgi:hypothetical protein